ncbi:hypothetical protein ABMA27_002938 [Loxostege sticticalis]|uniref:Transmembrane protein 131 n=1 Tax=Loxostege sticticalis TaxID=481309 RepID=A0ABR3HRF6_LOXSC
MYRKIVWCYVLVLTLLDISLNTKLTAQGKSHDVTVHDSLIEGISFQEWGKEADENAVGSHAAAEALRLTPAALRFGRAALGAAHALTVTLTNTHNATVHLASVAGTTPDFHASFFESKTLPPNGNTTFSVVYLGRREGPVAAHLYIHTSLGVHKYPVSAEGVASEWGVWPLVGLRVPHNATLDPVLTLYNPTDKHIQVREVYSSGSWVGLRLPGGGGAAPREAWRVPPHSSRALVRLALRLPHAHPPHAHQPHAHPPRPLTAYIRIKGDNVGGGGGLVVAVEATAAPAGSFLLPPQLRLRARGSRDPPHTLDISAGNSGAAPVRVEAAVWGARCAAQPLELPPPPPDHHTANGQLDRATHNGVKSEGAHVTVLRPQLDAHQEATQTLQLTLDYARLWSSYASSGSDTLRPEHGMWCGGYVRMGASAVPYSLRLLPGTLHLTPQQIEVVTASREEALREREVRVRNEFPVPVLVSAIDYGPEISKHFHVVEQTPIVLAPDTEAVVGRVRLRSASAGQLHATLAIRTNLTRLELPVLLHSGALQLEWDWPNSSDGHLRVGAVGASSTRRIGVQLYNPTPAVLCVREHSVRLPAAQFALPDQRCISPGARAPGWLTVVAPARAGALAGSVHVRTPHADTRAAVSLAAHAGRLTAPPLAHQPAAPYAWSAAPLVLESSMALGMRVLNVTQPQPDPAVSFVPTGSGWVTAGKHTVGTVYYAPERACEPRCYTGLELSTPEGLSWLRRGESGDRAALREDAELLRERRALFTPHVANITLYVHTSEVVQIPVTGSVAAAWPALRVGGALGGAGLLAGVGGAAAARVRVRNPAARPLLLQPRLTHHHHHRPAQANSPSGPHDPDNLLHPQDVEGIDSFCKKNKCVWSHEAFSISSWHETQPHVTEYRAGNDSHPPILLLAPGAELELTLTLTPTRASPLAAYLYLRNNLTVVEIIPVWGRGAYPSFELGGRRPGSTSPLLFEVTECGEASGGGVVRRTVTVHNTGDVPLKLRDWRLAGRPCQARGFRLQPCAPMALAPNETRALRLAFAADYTLARVPAPLSVRAGDARLDFALRAAAPAQLLRACAATHPRPPFEPALRAAGTLLALAALALRRAFERWRAEVLRRADDDEDDHSSEEADVREPLTAPPEPETRDRDRSRSVSPPTAPARVSSSESVASGASAASGESSVGSDSSRADDPRDDSEPEPPPPARPRGRTEPAAHPHEHENDIRTDDVPLPRSARRPTHSPPRRSAPLPPIGSDVRRRAETERPAADHSLFYFNGDTPPPAPAPTWRATPPLERPAYSPPQTDYRNEFDDNCNSHAHAYGSLWAGAGVGGVGAGSAWAWGGGFAGVRPPPGFAAPPPPRAYDPFRSLAAIWAPGALDWRHEPAAPAAAPHAAPPADAHASSLDAPASRSAVSKTE